VTGVVYVMFVLAFRAHIVSTVVSLVFTVTVVPFLIMHFVRMWMFIVHLGIILSGLDTVSRLAMLLR
jgi:hypothetical protein